MEGKFIPLFIPLLFAVFFVSGCTQYEKQTQPSRIQVSVDDDPVKGSKDAPVTIIEFSNFNCPYCRAFYTETLPLIEKDYIETGKVKLVYRDFTRSPLSQKAAEAAECAAEQGKFWEYHDKIFDNQQLLSNESLKQWASDLGLDTKKFSDCLDSGKMASEVKKDLRDAKSYGVTRTPTIFINGIVVEGAQPYSVYQQIIRQELSK